VQIDRVFAGRDAAAVSDFVVEAGDVAPVPQVVAQQVEDPPALVGVPDRHVARRLDPEIDVGIEFLGPAQLDHQIARRLRGGLGSAMAAVSGPFGPRGRSAQQHGQDALPTVVPAGVEGRIEPQNPDKLLRQIPLVELVAPVLDGQLGGHGISSSFGEPEPSANFFMILRFFLRPLSYFIKQSRFDDRY